MGYQAQVEERSEQRQAAIRIFHAKFPLLTGRAVVRLVSAPISLLRCRSTFFRFRPLFLSVLTTCLKIPSDREEDPVWNRLPENILIQTSRGDVGLDVKLSEITAGHYSQALWDGLLESRKEHHWQFLRFLLPQSRVKLLLDTRSAWPDHKLGDDSLALYRVCSYIRPFCLLGVLANPHTTWTGTNYNCLVSMESAVVVNKDSKGPFWVRLLKVQAHQAQFTQECDVRFDFDYMQRKFSIYDLEDIYYGLG